MKVLALFLSLIMLLSGCVKSDSENDLPDNPEQNRDVMYINGWTADFEPSDFDSEEEYYEAFLDEYVKTLEPMEFFETEKEYPAVILEIFDKLDEEETEELFKCDELLKVEVSGDENEFYVSYSYRDKEGTKQELKIRVRKIEDGKYGLLGRGGGAPISHGLEKTDLTLEDIK